jgi:hypothetical protein
VTDRAATLLRKSGLSLPGNSKAPLALEPPALGQRYPQRCPQLDGLESTVFADPLGDPLPIGEVAALIGCSPWTVRQRYLPQGLPHHRATSKGKLIFYRNQVIRWLLCEQQKGGKKK